MAALRVANSALLVLAIVGAVLLGEHALQFRELGEFLATDREVRMAVFALWTLAMAPAARAGVLAPGLGYLRWLPLPGWLAPLYLLALVVSLHGVVGLPALVAGFPAAGIGIALAGIGIGSNLLPGPPTWQDSASRLVGTGALVALVSLGHWEAVSGLSVVITAWRLPRVWRRGAELGEGRGRGRRLCGGARLSLLSAQSLHLWRRESVLLVRTLAVATLSVILIRVIRHANVAPVSLASLLVASTPALAIVSVMLALGLKRARRELCWIMRSLGVSLSRERLGSLAIVAVLCALLAGIGAQVANAGAWEAMVAAVYGAGWAVVALALSSPARIELQAVSRAFVLALVAMLVVGLGGERTLPLLLVGTLLAARSTLFGEVADA